MVVLGIVCTVADKHKQKGVGAMKKIGKPWFPDWVSACIVWPFFGFALIVGVVAFIVGFTVWGLVNPTRFIPKAKEYIEDWNNRY